MTAIWGSRQKAKLALKRNVATSKHDSNSLLTTINVSQGDKEVDLKSPASDARLRNAGSREPTARSIVVGLYDIFIYWY